jgi:acyl carrier protein
MAWEIEAPIRTFIRENFARGEETDSLDRHESLQERGLLDSIGVLLLVTFLEETFSFEILDEEVSPENLDSIHCLVQFVGRKLGPMTPETATRRTPETATWMTPETAAGRKVEATHAN